jgi:hypothetical protein
LIRLDTEYWFLIAPIALGLIILARHGPKWLGRFRWIPLGLAVVMVIPPVIDADYEIPLTRITTPIALCLAILGWYGPKRLGRTRWVFLAAAVVMANPLGIKEAYKFQLNRTLYHDEVVLGQLLPAGSIIRFRNHERTYFDFIKLPRVTEIDGIPFTGTISFRSGGDTPPRWYGTLAADHVIDGWPCARGEIATRRGDKLLTCKLATPQTFFDYGLPAGTIVFGDWKVWRFELPLDEELNINALSATAPAGSKVTVSSDGHLQGIRLEAGQTIVVHGVPLKASIELAEHALVGEIAEPFVVAGEQRPAGTKVSIDLGAGVVSLLPE